MKKEKQMDRPECAVKECKNPAFVAYGSNWVCGECMVKILKKQAAIKNKEIEELGI